MNALSANITNICAGIGVGYLPRSAVSAFIAQGLMREYEVYDPYKELNVIFVCRWDRIMDAVFQRFLETLQAYRR